MPSYRAHVPTSYLHVFHGGGEGLPRLSQVSSPLPIYLLFTHPRGAVDGGLVFLFSLFLRTLLGPKKSAVASCCRKLSNLCPEKENKPPSSINNHCYSVPRAGAECLYQFKVSRRGWNTETVLGLIAK